MQYTLVAPASRDVQAAQLEEVWQDLGAANVRGPQACGVFYGARQGPAFLAKHLDARQPAADRKDLARMLRDLDDDAFAVRERASLALAGLGVAAVPALEEALENGPSLEAHQRLRRLLDQASGLPLLSQLRRSIEVLVCLGTPEARRLLQGFAASKEKTMVAELAQAALPRLPDK